MIKHYCDICGKEMQNKTVIEDTDPLDYQYGECRICFDIGLQGIYEVGFDEICHECKKRIENIDMDDFQEVLIENLMGIKEGIKIMSINRTFPCKDCPDRARGCHGYCAEYKSAKEYNEKIKEYKRQLADIDDFVIKSIVKKTRDKKVYTQRTFTYN